MKKNMINYHLPNYDLAFAAPFDIHFAEGYFTVGGIEGTCEISFGKDRAFLHRGHEGLVVMLDTFDFHATFLENKDEDQNSIHRGRSSWLMIARTVAGGDREKGILSEVMGVAEGSIHGVWCENGNEIRIGVSSLGSGFQKFSELFSGANARTHYYVANRGSAEIISLDGSIKPSHGEGAGKNKVYIQRITADGPSEMPELPDGFRYVEISPSYLEEFLAGTGEEGLECYCIEECSGNKPERVESGLTRSTAAVRMAIRLSQQSPAFVAEFGGDGKKGIYRVVVE